MGCFVLFTSCTNYGQDATREEQVVDAEKSKAFFMEAEVYKQGSVIQLELYDSAIYYNPLDHDIYFKKSIWYKKSGQFIKSFEILDKAVELAPTIHLGYRAWSKLYYMRDFKGCIADIERLDSLTPGFVDYPWGESMHYLLGQCYMELNEYDRAIQYFDLHLAEFDEGDEFYSQHYKAVCLYFLADYSAALVAFEKAVSIYGENPDAHYYKALCHIVLNDKKMARIEAELCDKWFNSGYRFTLPFIQPFRTIYQPNIDALLKASE
jgi:tetratricopeptide (TPR) repeat protein